MTSINLKDYSKYILFFIVLLLLYISYKIISPLLPAILSAIVFTILLHPLYIKIYQKVKIKSISSLIIIILILLFVIIPLLFFASALFNEAKNVFNSVNSLDLTKVSEDLQKITGLNINFERYIRENLQNLSKFFLFSSSDILQFLIQGIISLFVMFFLVYLLLIKGNKLITKIKRIFPMKKEDKDRLFYEIDSIIKGLFKGLFLIALLEGIVAWIGFTITGVPNPLIWSVLIAIFALIPVVGPLLVWPPAVLYLIFNNQLTNAIILAIYSGILLTYLDSVLKPILIGQRSKIDPVIILIGIFGGIELMGLIGIIIGPLVLSILVVIYKIYEEKNLSQPQA